MEKMLVVYYSWSNGNTKRIAEQMSETCMADIARIETVDSYDGSYDEVVVQGQREVEQHYQPAIKDIDYVIDDYDIIAVGTPTWWYTMAPAVFSFLNQHNWKGKTVIPFMTHGGWPGHVLQDMKNICQGASILMEKEIQFDSNGGDYMETSTAEINEWLFRISQITNKEK